MYKRAKSAEFMCFTKKKVINGENPIANDKSSCIKSSFHHKICYWLTIYHWNAHSHTPNTYTWLHLNSIGAATPCHTVPCRIIFVQKNRRKKNWPENVWFITRYFCSLFFRTLTHHLILARSFHKIITNLDKLIAFCVSPVTASDASSSSTKLTFCVILRVLPFLFLFPRTHFLCLSVPILALKHLHRL